MESKRISLAPESSTEAARSLHSPTRSQTLIGVMDRLLAQSEILKLSNSNGDFVLHVVGADENECPSLDAKVLASMYREILLKFKALNVNRLAILFSGPNLIPDEVSKSSISFLFEDTMQVTVRSAPTCYHEIIKSKLFEENPSDAFPTLTIMYNPGIWGYSSWLYTLSAFLEDTRSRSDKYKPIYVMTAYTLEEAEEDYDKVVAHFESQGLNSIVLSSGNSLADDSHNNSEDLRTIAWLWECESNPFCSAPALERRSAATSSPYKDSQFWSSFSFI